MNSNEFISEGVLDYVKRALQLSWGSAGDTVRGSVVADYLSHSTYHSDANLKSFANSKFQLRDVDLATARKFRDFTDNNTEYGLDDTVIDPDKMRQAQQRKITYASLVKNPPVVDRDGFIWDGNHRIERAIELSLRNIPVLMQL